MRTESATLYAAQPLTLRCDQAAWVGGSYGISFWKLPPATRRLGVTWCHGIAADPVRLHAWVQTEDCAPAAEPPSTGDYTPVLTLGARHHRQP
ncbi:lasso peptide biosynthesis B2 protein [Streptomyces sp. NPDC092296]|uniref:lasso peptide biosynthesis B2 protein n=1 Tax=Streptomyces sp. NPDC092296 TaxID=3366012 RepID=UPI00382C6B69